ncbi:MAG: Cys-Xaa-Xaa-Xaa repeat radical SAM target protein [Paraprevotella sp.]|nr:Cys-Xaa-Xaa-Xaa repeat radical SAM target protein [Paraprevotella sp.]
MEKKNQNEELQSRREFFKKAAKGALPILGAVVLAGAPAIVNAAEPSEPMGCTRYGCGTCTGSCRSTCSGGCSTTCSGGCKHYACKGVAKN